MDEIVEVSLGIGVAQLGRKAYPLLDRDNGPLFRPAAVKQKKQVKTVITLTKLKLHSFHTLICSHRKHSRNVGQGNSGKEEKPSIFGGNSGQ